MTNKRINEGLKLYESTKSIYSTALYTLGWKKHRKKKSKIIPKIYLREFYGIYHDDIELLFSAEASPNVFGATML